MNEVREFTRAVDRLTTAVDRLRTSLLWLLLWAVGAALVATAVLVLAKW